MQNFLMSYVLCILSFSVFSAEFIEGQDYQVIPSMGDVAYKSGPIHVTEFFSYGCPWCYRLDAAISKWTSKQGKAIQMTKIPVVFHDHWDDYARAYYIIDELSLGKTVHERLFKTIIVDKQPLATHQAMVDFFKNNGVESSLAESALNQSPSIELRLKTDQALMSKYQINAIPTLVINQQYKTNLQMAKTEERLFEILDYLLAKTKHESLY
jgi:thiol:disulfide interchange protein DsbA